MTTLLLETALLPDGWAHNVALTVSDGVITGIETSAHAGVGERLGGIVVPGLPNVHSHTFQRGMAGLVELRGPSHDDFWTWREVMYAFVDAITPDDLEAIASFAMMEMLEAGFTALGEFHYLHHAPGGTRYADLAELGGRIVAAAETTGIGLTLLPALYTQGGFDGRPLSGGQLRFGTDLDGYFSLVEASRAAVRWLDDARRGMAPHSLRAVGPDTLQELLRAGLDGPIHMHLAEQVKEVNDCIASSGQRPATWLFAHAAMDARWCLVHATHLDATEIALLVRSGAVVGLCPLTEANLGDGIFAGTQAAAGRGHGFQRRGHRIGRAQAVRI
jgi:formimidoylglutamate deiminase